MSESEILREIYPVSRETLERLEILVDRLVAWQKKTNLVAPSTLDDIWNRHVADSLQCLALKPTARHWLDLGSGGGFPGLVIAAVMADYTDSTVMLVESNQKKTAFLRQVNRQMGANATILTSRIEEVNLPNFSPDVVTARALIELPALLNLSSPWLEEGAEGLFHKGRDYREELAKSDGLYVYDLICHKSKVAADSVILEISNFARNEM